MVVIARPIVFDENSPAPMYRHLDRWAAQRLASPEAWGSMVERCEQWLDYSPRNQVLLASYGVVGAVAGTATWARVPSSEPERFCAPRAGEHGLPIRVPIVAEGYDDFATFPAPGPVGVDRGGSPVGSRVRRRAAGPPAGAGCAVAAGGAGAAAGEWNEVVRRAAGRMTGRTPRKVVDPTAHLVSMAAKAPPPVGPAAVG